jgi:transcriptional regulator with XRE-family HTH domain
MARRQISGAQLATKVGKSQSYISKRLRADAQFSVNDIEDICRVLEVELLALLHAAVRSTRG